jgi:hypothetical protein
MRTINDILITGRGNPYIFYYNLENDAHFSINKRGVIYHDPVGNKMTSSSTNIKINSRFFRLEKFGDEIKGSDGTRTIMMPKEKIQEIANKTFYADGQFHTIDFLTFTITEEK